MIDLSDLLARTADQTPVGLPPLDALHAGAIRRRRRRTAGLTATAVVAVAAVIGGTTLLSSHDQTAPVTSPTQTPAPVPPATRLVGFGHVAIAIPADWPTNKSMCGTPLQDTLLLDDPTEGLLCMADRPPRVESVAVYYGRPRVDFHADRTLEIDGVRAERQQTSCSTSNYPQGKVKVTTCVSTVRIPSLDVWFRAESSTSAAEVDRMLSAIRILPKQTGVPSYWSAAVAPQGALWENYAPRLAVAGLKAAFKMVKSPSYPSGTVLSVSPAPGTVLAAGSTVTVTLAK